MARGNTALKLAARGFQVFPVKPGAKHPPLVRFKDEATTDPAKIRSWWTQWPQANIGVHCAGWLVVDIDPGRGGDAGALGLPPTLVAETPSGGQHLYYRCTENVPNSVDKVAPGVDIRAAGGYVLAPGSVTPAGPYRWAEPRAPEWAPETLVAAARSVRVKPQGDRGDPSPVQDTETAAARARHWLETAQPAVEGAGGDHLTFRTVARVRDFGVPEDDACEVLSEWNARCSPPWDPETLQRKIENVYRYAQNAPGSDSAEAMFEPVPVSSEPARPRTVDTADPEMYGPDEVTVEQALAGDYLVKGWLDRATSAMLFGPYGSGKTFIALNLAAHVAAGKPWFDARVKPGGVLYAGYEGAAAMRRRVYALRQQYPDWDLAGLQVRPLDRPLVAPRSGDAQTAGQEALRRALGAYKRKVGAFPSLIILDPLRNALGGSDSDPDLTVPFANYCSRLSKATGAAVLVVHHPGHSDQDRSRGDSGIEAGMDTVLRVNPDRGAIETRKQRDEPAAEVHYRLEIVDIGEDIDGDMRTTCVVERVSPNPIDPALTDSARGMLIRLRELCGEGGEFTKSDFNTLGAHLSGEARTEVWHTLRRKHYVEPEGNRWRLGAGAAAMFDAADDILG